MSRRPPRTEATALAALRAAGAGRWRVADGRLHLDATARRLLGERSARLSLARWLARRAPVEAEALRGALQAGRPVSVTLHAAGGPLLMRGSAHAGRADGLLLPAPPAGAAAPPGHPPRDEFVAAVAHELRTPLNAIVGFAHMARAELGDAPAARHLVPIEAASTLMLRVVNDLLDLARLDAGRLEIDPDQPLDLPALVARVGEVGASLRQDKPVALFAHVDPRCPARLRGDGGRLEQVLLNLVANALKFTARGRVVLAVKAGVPDRGVVRLRFSVADTGAGIALEALERLGRPFERVRRTLPERTDGSGLGLAVVHRLLALHGSTLKIASVDGGGTICWFELQLPVDDAACAAPQPSDWAVRSDDRLFHASVATQWRARGRLLAAPDGAVRHWIVDAGAADAVAFMHDRRAAGHRAVAASAAPAAEAETLALLGARLLGTGRPVPPAAAGTLAGLRVLVLEDNLLNQRVVAEFLDRAGAHPVIADDGAQALARVEREHFDIALVDLQLHGESGLEVMRRLRGHPAAARLPFALLSAHVDPADRQAAEALGALACLGKPFDPAQLLALLQRVARPAASPLRQLFARQWPAQRAALAQPADARALRREVHALRGSLAVLGDQAGLALARRVEEGLAAGRPPAELPLAALLARADGLAAA